MAKALKSLPGENTYSFTKAVLLQHDSLRDPKI
jgi:hypothetical protein